MKKLILLIAIAAVFIGGTQTTFAQSKKKGASNIAAYLPSGVKLKRAKPSQIQSAFNKALRRNPGAIGNMLSQIASSGKLSGGQLLGLFQSALSNPSISGNKDLVLSLFSTLSSSIGNDPDLQKQLGKLVIGAAPELKTQIQLAIAKNTGGKVNSNEV